MRGETFLFSSLIIALIILFFGINVFMMSPISLKSFDAEVLYCRSLNILIDKYFYMVLRHYPLSRDYIDKSMNNFVYHILRYKSLGGLNVNHISVSTLFSCRYNHTFSYIYCSSTFNISIGDLSFKRSLKYNLSLSILNYNLNGSILSLNYSFIENELPIHPVNATIWFYYNGSWVKIKHGFKVFDNHIVICLDRVSPSKLFLDFIGFIGVRITAIVDF
ncbi:MAG: hypothetical protein QW743_05100 [Candidatus Methanomethylicia archaeon]